MPVKKKSKPRKSKPIYIEPIESKEAARAAPQFEEIKEEPNAEFEGDEVQSKPKVSSWPSWEEQEEKEVPEEKFEPMLEPKPALKSEGIMVVYDAPTPGENPIIEINTPQAVAGNINVEVVTESSMMAKVGFLLSVIGALVTIAGVIAGIWYGTHQIEFKETLYFSREGFILTTVLLGVGVVLMLLGVVLSLYGRHIRVKPRKY